MRGKLFFVACLWLSLSTAALAHHSFSAEFDATKPIEITGVLTKVDWTNPHIYFYLDVKEKDGSTTQWAFESLPPLWFHRAGLQRSDLSVGETLTVTGFAAKDGTKHLGWVKKFHFQDGRDIQITAGDVNDQAK